MGECVGELEAIGELFADVDCYEGFEVVEKGDWAAVVDLTGFWDGSD